MKNLFLLPTNQPSRLIIYSTLLNDFRLLDKPIEDWKHKKNIYITNDEEIKEGDFVVENTTSPRPPYIGKTFYPKNDGTVTEEILKRDLLSVSFKGHYETLACKRTCKKIILTTDQELIKNGIQPIPDEFLEWFVKNPSCESVEVKCYSKFNDGDFTDYKIIIPKEEPKQETLEEYIQSLFTNEDEDNKILFSSLIRSGAKWQQEQDNNKYSQEDIINALHNVELKDKKDYSKIYNGMKEWFEQNKKK
jgi:hypothetical protein